MKKTKELKIRNTTIQANIYRFIINVNPFILLNQNTSNDIIKLLL